MGHRGKDVYPNSSRLPSKKIIARPLGVKNTPVVAHVPQKCREFCRVQMLAHKFANSRGPGKERNRCGRLQRTPTKESKDGAGESFGPRAGPDPIEGDIGAPQSPAVQKLEPRRGVRHGVLAGLSAYISRIPPGLAGVSPMRATLSLARSPLLEARLCSARSPGPRNVLDTFELLRHTPAAAT